MLRVYGDQRAPALVLLHGFGFNGDMWSEWCAELKNDFYLLVPDLPGYDASVTEDSVGIFEDAELLLAQLPPRAYYAGWSLGGLFALWLAEHRTERVRGVITMGTNPCFAARPGWRAGVSGADLDKFRSIATTSDKNTMIRRLVALVVRGAPEPLRLEKHLRTLACRPADATLMCGLNILRDTDMRDAVARSQVSMMHVVGDSDAMVSPALAEALRTLAPRQQVEVLTDTGHALPWSRRSRIIALLRAFIGSGGQ